MIAHHVVATGTAMTAFKPRQTLTEQVAMPVDKCSLRALGLGFLVILLSACASSPPEDVPRVITPEQPVPESTEASDPEPEQAPAPARPQSRIQPREPDKPCAWSQTRGVATLTAIAQKHGVAEGTWLFFPGDEVMFHPVPDEARKGDEYKALLRRPLSGDCKHPRLIIVSPL